MHKSNLHPYHMVTLSPWPLLTSLNMMILMAGGVKLFHEFSWLLFIWGLMSLIMSIMQWWRDVTRESTYQGCHSIKVSILMRWGMTLFIISEIFFFFSFFWAFFHNSLSPSIDIGNSWPPMLIQTFNPYSIPLLNTIILLSSGITITWSHLMIINKNFKESLISINLTILLGIYFTILQYTEYTEAPFNISDSIYGSTFFMITGFHGVHVIIGTLFIFISMLRLNSLHFSSTHHFGFEASSWYWHFVDVVWLFVYISIYWWNY